MSKKILFITYGDITSHSGGSLANRAFYESLAQHHPDHVDVIQYNVEKGNQDDPHFFYMPPASRFYRLWLILQGRIHRLYDWLFHFLDARKGEYHLCIINSGLFGDLVPKIKERGISVVTIHHNFEVAYQIDNKRALTIWGLTPYFVRRNERKAYLYSDLNVFLSDHDRQLMSAYYGKSCAQDVVVGVYDTQERTKELQLARTTNEKGKNVAMTGWLNHLQTELGIADFRSQYYELFKQIMPSSSQLIVTGRTPGKEVLEFAKMDSRIVLIPNPDIISEVIKDCCIYLCPVNVGSGVKLRILDGIRLGMPVLVHEVSARGYEAFFDKPWFQSYDDAQSFESGLKSILYYMEHTANYRAEIIYDYQSHFSFEVGDKRFMEALSKLMN